MFYLIFTILQGIFYSSPFLQSFREVNEISRYPVISRPGPSDKGSFCTFPLLPSIISPAIGNANTNIYETFDEQSVCNCDS